MTTNEALARRIGIGPALRKARLLRSKSIEEASRETRIRAEYLHALEHEQFDALLGDVYVRAFLRSYSNYLGLDASKVLTIYNRHFGDAKPTLPDPTPAPIKSPRSPHPHLPQLVRHHPSWTFLILIALFVLVVFGAVGLLSRSKSAPPAEGAVTPSAIPALPPTVTVSIRAIRPVQAVIRRDGKVAFRGLLRKDESRTFRASTSIEVQLDQGKAAAIVVNGHSVGVPGDAASVFTALWGPQDYRGKPSPSAP